MDSAFLTKYLPEKNRKPFAPPGIIIHIAMNHADMFTTRARRAQRAPKDLTGMDRICRIRKGSFTMKIMKIIHESAKERGAAAYIH